jgi:mannose-6-phosphate isomerase-like protein (cupin superfamily)
VHACPAIEPEEREIMKLTLVVMLIVPLVLPLSASAQILGQEDLPVTQPAMTGQYWAPKPAQMTPYVAPNKPHWRLSESLEAHKGQGDWVQALVRNKDQEADYISMSAGKKTKTKMWPDDRLVFIVWEGSIKVSIDGYQPFTATKGFMVNVPFRHMYTLENVGTTSALRFEVRQTGSTPIYPASETPDPIPGVTYVKVTEQPGPAKEKDSNPIYVDYMKEFNGTNKPYGGKFVWDDHFTSNILRGPGVPVPPDTNKGHFHIGWTEFWFIMEGHIGMKVEGEPYFVCDPGDVMIAAQGRWHRAGDDPSAPWSTRVPFNPRPPVLHNFEVGGD